MENQEMVCYCANVTKGDIVAAMDKGAKTFEDIRKMTGACTEGNCKELSPRKTCCSPIILQVMKEYENEHQ